MSEPAIAAARKVALECFQAALAAVDPEVAVAREITLEEGRLLVGDEPVPLPGGVHLVAVGKAAVAMAQGALSSLGDAVVSGDVITKEGHAENPLPERIRVHEAGHPIPDARGVEGTRDILRALEGLTPETVVLALISGGGSALLEAPREPLTLADFAQTTDTLLRAGAPIDALNAVRSPMSKVKAGGLRAAAAESTWVTLILSDVLGNDPRVIASGPTVTGGSDATKALEVIDRYEVRDVVPVPVIELLEQGTGPDGPHATAHDALRIIGDNAKAVDAAKARAESLGLRCQVVWRAVEGEAAELGREFVGLVSGAPADVDVLIGGGEGTVTVRGDGLGGRNTEFALAAALEMERLGVSDWLVASLATDGQDAMTGLAGAMADGGTAARARQAGIDPEAALHRNDSRVVFDAAGGAVDTGPTGTNVNDVYIAVRVARQQSDGEGG